MNLNINQSENEFKKKNVTKKFTEKVKQKFEKKIRKTKNNKSKFRKIKFSNFKLVKRFKKIAIYQKFLITSIETNFMCVDATNVKSQKNVFVFDRAFKSNKLKILNSVIESVLKRSAMNISKK